MTLTTLPASAPGAGRSRNREDCSDRETTIPGPSKQEDPTLDDSPAELGADTHITTRYLTFDTVLPTANLTRSSPSSIEAPPPPDLAKYTSPLQWPRSRKNVLLFLSCVATFLTAYTAGAYSPPSERIARDLGASKLGVMAGITTFCVGFALAPMVLAPLSEINGRYPVFVVSGFVYVGFQAACALVNNLAGMLVARFLVGVGGSVFSTMVGGVIADLWTKEERNTPMALFSGAVLAGTGAGPWATAVMVYELDDNGGDWWKWLFWHQVIVGILLLLALILLFKESRGSVVLSRKARVLNEWYEKREQAGFYGVWVEETLQQQGEPDVLLLADDESQQGSQLDVEKASTTSRSLQRSLALEIRLRRIRWIVKEDEQRSSIGNMISVSVYRPFHLLFTEPVVFFFSIWVAFAWAVLYLTFASVPLVFMSVRKWNLEQSGHMFAPMIVGAILSTVLGILQERLLHSPKWRSANEGTGAGPGRSRFWMYVQRRFPPDVPEARLYFSCVTSILLPVGLLMFGFTSDPHIHWMAPAVAIVLATMGIYSVYLATFNYLADAYQAYASSALAAQSCCRNLLGGVFPLVTQMMYSTLGNAKVGGLLGGIALGLTAVPWVLVFFGETIRRRSNFAVSLGK